MELYEIVEHKKEYNDLEISLFDGDLELLTFEKMFLLFERLQKYQRESDKKTVALTKKKNEMLLTVDFVKELDEKRPTVAMKEAYLDKKLEKENNEITALNEKIAFYKDKLKVVNDLINNKRLLLRFEANLNEE